MTKGKYLYLMKRLCLQMIRSYIVLITMRIIYLAFSVMKIRLLCIKAVIRVDKMSEEFTKCPCDEAPYPWCNNAEGCGSCPEYEAWLRENGL